MPKYLLETVRRKKVLENDVIDELNPTQVTANTSRSFRVLSESAAFSMSARISGDARSWQQRVRSWSWRSDGRSASSSANSWGINMDQPGAFLGHGGWKRWPARQIQTWVLVYMRMWNIYIYINDRWYPRSDTMLLFRGNIWKSLACGYGSNRYPGTLCSDQ